jgi:hypothetical protein
MLDALMSWGKAPEGRRMTEHHPKLIRHSMEHLAFLEEEIAELEMANT